MAFRVLRVALVAEIRLYQQEISAVPSIRVENISLSLTDEGLNRLLLIEHPPMDLFPASKTTCAQRFRQ